MLMASTVDRFPEGLRVLVVDNDTACVKKLEKMLKNCKYQVTIRNLGQEALNLIESSRDEFDIVISDENLPDMDGCMFPEKVRGLNVELPVIMMSVEGETSRVMKGVQGGACHYLLKPIKVKEVRNIWQHVIRKRIKQDFNTVENETPINGADSCNYSGETVSVKESKDNAKKARIVWTHSLHQKFVQVVERIGLEKAGPKKILNMMGVPWLSRDNVASHWQKYRLQLLKEKKKKEDELKAAVLDSQNTCPQSGVNQNSLTLQQNIVINHNFVAPGGGLHMQCSGGSISEGNGNVGGMRSMPMQGGENFETADYSMSYNQQLRKLDLAMASQSQSQSQSKILTFSGGAPPSQLMPYFQSDNRYDQFPHNPADTNNSHLYSYNTPHNAFGTENTTPPLPHNSPIFDPLPQILDNDLKCFYGIRNT